LKENLRKNFPEKHIFQKNIFQKKFANFLEKVLRNFFLPTVVEVSSNELK